jgi:glycerol-3-phosphate dehydrogenase
LVINATGAWGDFTLEELHVPAPRLFGGTKGSHLVTYQARLKQAIGDAGVYAEADDGRLIFVLPFGDGVLVGTTDDRFDGRPESAVATPDELNYLVSTVNELFPEVALSLADVTLSYSGVRPLPRADAGSAGSISRDHFLDEHRRQGLTVFTLVGGKLTTSRAFGELVADKVLSRLQIPRVALTTARIVPGGEGTSTNRAGLPRVWTELAARYSLDPRQVEAMWGLCGSLVESALPEILGQNSNPDDRRSLAGSWLPRGFVRWVIEHEWVDRLDDLVERRLMLVYERDLSSETLVELSQLLVECGRLGTDKREAAVHRAGDRLREVYGRCLTG